MILTKFAFFSFNILFPLFQTELLNSKPNQACLVNQHKTEFFFNKNF